MHPRFLSVRSFLLIGGFALAAVTSVSAQTAPASTAAIRWPDTARPALTYSTREVPFDGIDITVGLLSGSGIAWENTLFQSWIIARDPAGHSISFISRAWPNLRMGISVFGPKEFLPDISDEVWDRYLAGLQLAHDNKCDILNQLSATAEGSPWVPVLSAKTRSLTIRYPAGDTGFNAETQLFAFCEDHLVVFVLSGPEKEVQAATPGFYSIVRTVRTHRPQAK